MTTKATSRRTQILSAARSILAEKGFEATTVSEIVASAGVAQGTFYLYFPSKVSLVEALCEEMFAQILEAVHAAITSAESFAAGLGAGVQAVFEESQNYQDVLEIINARLGFLSTPSELAKLDEPYYQLVKAFIEQGQTSGEVRVDADPDLSARLVVGMIERATEDCFLYRPELPSEPYIKEVTRFILRALEPPRSEEQEVRSKK